MSKFLVTSDSHFKPFSYEELVRPVAEAAAAHNAAQDVYDSLYSETSALEHYLMREPNDSEARRLYDSYISKLNSLQNNLWENGYNASTRRDLSAARAGYQSNITRLATAVKDRSERSAAYWDARHKNPNLVTSGDPGLDSLDAYLKDENHGMNWFSYDSSQFEKEVSSEMQNRAQSILDGLTDENGVVRNPALADTLTRVIKHGVTPGEVDAASILVDKLVDMTPQQREQFYQSNGVSPVVSMMTETLINRYDATGIRGYDVSPNERQRLLNRGKAGLAGGIMAPEIKDFTDPEYEYQMWKRKEDYQHMHRMSEKSAGSSGSGNGNNRKKTTTGGDSGGYSLQTLASYLDSPEAKEITSFVNKKFEKKFEEPIPVTGTDGKPDSINSPYDAKRILDELGLDEFYKKYGIDPTEKIVGTYEMKGHGKVTVSSASGGYAGDPNAYTISRDGKIDFETSKQFSNDYKAFKKRLDEWEKKNNVDLVDLKIKEKDWKKMADEHDIPEEIPREYWPSILTAKADIGYRTPAYLASYTSDMPEVRENYASAAYSAYVHAAKDGKGNVAKTSDVAVKKVTPDGKVIGVERDMRDVLGTKGTKGSNEIRTDTIQDITASPEDVINNQIRFTTSLYDGEYAANPVIFGNGVTSVYRDMRKPVYEVYNDGSTVLLDEKGIVDYMMKPIIEPTSAFTMSDAERRDWTRITANTLQNYMRFYQTDSSGNVTGVVSPITIVMYPAYREALRNAVSQYVDAGLAGPRDALNQEIMQKKSATVANPASMDLGLTTETE